MCCSSSWFVVFVDFCLFLLHFFLSFAFNSFICLSFSLYLSETIYVWPYSFFFVCVGFLSTGHSIVYSSLFLIATKFLIYSPGERTKPNRERKKEKKLSFLFISIITLVWKSFILYFDSTNRMSKCPNGVISCFGKTQKWVATSIFMATFEHLDGREMQTHSVCFLFQAYE